MSSAGRTAHSTGRSASPSSTSTGVYRARTRRRSRRSPPSRGRSLSTGTGSCRRQAPVCRHGRRHGRNRESLLRRRPKEDRAPGNRRGREFKGGDVLRRGFPRSRTSRSALARSPGLESPLGLMAAASPPRPGLFQQSASHRDEGIRAASNRRERFARRTRCNLGFDGGYRPYLSPSGRSGSHPQRRMPWASSRAEGPWEDASAERRRGCVPGERWRFRSRWGNRRAAGPSPREPPRISLQAGGDPGAVYSVEFVA